jgi:hypothetical protein
MIAEGIRELLHGDAATVKDFPWVRYVNCRRKRHPHQPAMPLAPDPAKVAAAVSRYGWKDRRTSMRP